ncbi:MAG: hypothetical protein ABR514_02965 [Chthoniobacterales bacterium]
MFSFSSLPSNAFTKAFEKVKDRRHHFGRGIVKAAGFRFQIFFMTAHATERVMLNPYVRVAGESAALVRER